MAMNYNRPLKITFTFIVFVILIGIVLLLKFQPRSIIYVLFAGILLSIAVIVKWRFMTFFYTRRHKKYYFSGTSSKTLQEILLSIDEPLPSEDELQQMKREAMPFLNEVRARLENRYSDYTFKCIFSGSLEERFGIPLSHKKTFPRQFNSLKTDMDVIFCCDNITAMFIDHGSSGNGPEVRIIDADEELQQHIILSEDHKGLTKEFEHPREPALSRPKKTGLHPKSTDLPRKSEIAIEDHLEEQIIPQDNPSFGNVSEHPCPEVTVLIEDLPDDVLEIPQIGLAQLKHTSGSRKDDILNSHKFIVVIHMVVLASKVSCLIAACFMVMCSWLPWPVPLADMLTGPSITIVSPSSTNKFVLFDMTFCIKCLQWPTTSDWPTRARSWPSLNDVHRIITKGFHLVAKPLLSDKPGHKRLSTWRYSFSIAEIELSKLVPETARKCFLAIKVIMKDHLNSIVPGLSSYYIKTIFYHTLEKTEPLFWVDDNIEECFFTLMREIHCAVLSQQCPHYWLKNVNLFDYIKGETSEERLPLLAQKLESIIQDPAPYIFDDGWSCNQMCNGLCTKRFRREHNHDLRFVDQEAYNDPSEIRPETNNA